MIPIPDLSSPIRSIRGLAGARPDVAARSLGYQNSSAFQKPRQKPSSARPTQLNANIEEAIATTDAKVTMVLTDGITEPRCRQRSHSAGRRLLNDGDNSS